MHSVSYQVSEHLLGLPGLSNVGRFNQNLYRGAQPEISGFQTLWTMGIKTVLALRVLKGEEKEVKSYGMTYISLPMSTFTKVNTNILYEALKVMRDEDSWPVFVHCQHGADRTGVVCAVYRMQFDRWSEREAEQEMQDFGFHDIWFQMKMFVRWYRPTLFEG